jgi:hypothetical protein
MYESVLLFIDWFVSLLLTMFQEFPSELRDDISDTIEALKWARTVVDIFGEEITVAQHENDKSEHFCVVLPILPIPNYHPHKEVTFDFDKEKRVLFVKSFDTLLPYHEWSYCARSFNERENSELIMSYGMVTIEENVFETFPLEISLVKDELFEKKRALLQQFHLEYVI